MPAGDTRDTVISPSSRTVPGGRPRSGELGTFLPPFFCPALTLDRTSHPTGSPEMGGEVTPDMPGIFKLRGVGAIFQAQDDLGYRPAPETPLHGPENHDTQQLSRSSRGLGEP